MKFLLTAPFHTDLNLKTFQAYRDQRSAIAHLTDVIDALNKEIEHAWWKINWQIDEDKSTLYRTLNDNYFSNASKPIITLQISDLNWLKFALNHQLNCNEFESPIDFEVDSCLVHYYDNTIGILSLIISTGEQTELSDLDSFTFELSNTVIVILQNFLNKASESFDDNPYFLSKRESNIIFGIEKYSCYWVNRAAVVSEDCFNKKYTEFERWSKLYNNDHDVHDFHEYKIYFCIGNSIIIDDDKLCISSYLESLNLATYFYCLYLSLNNRVSTIFENIENAKLFDINYHTIYKIERLLLFIDNQNEQIVFGLQGDSKKIVNAFYKIWEVDVLRENLESKTIRVHEIYKHERLKKSEKTTKIVQGTLTIIGASAIVEVLLNIFLFTHEDFDIKYEAYGLASFIRTINPELVLVLNLIILLCLALIVIHEMRKK